MFSKRVYYRLDRISYISSDEGFTPPNHGTLGTAMAIPRVPRPQKHIQRAYTWDLNEISASEDDSELEALGALGPKKEAVVNSEDGTSLVRNNLNRYPMQRL